MVKMEEKIKRIKANLKMTADQKSKAIEAARQKFKDGKPQPTEEKAWKLKSQTAGAGDSARVFHAEIQIDTYLKQNLRLSEAERKNFVIQASKPYCKHCEEIMDGRYGKVE